jgi:hypothetical protein
MSKQKGRGRDPIRAEKHTTAQANAYTGMDGEISLVDNGSGIVGARLHDGQLLGGSPVNAAPAGSAARAYPGAAVVPQSDVTLVSATPFTITHNLGYFPLVQVLQDSNDTVLTDVTVIHTSVNAFTLTRSTGIAVHVLMR